MKERSVLILFLLATLIVGAGLVEAAPTVTITIPASSGVVSGNYLANVSVVADVDADLVTNITINVTQLDGVIRTWNITAGALNVSANQSSYDLSQDTSVYQDGTWTMTATAWGQAGAALANSAAITVVVNNTIPTFSLSPVTGTKLDKTAITVTSTEEVSAVTIMFDSNSKSMSSTDTNKTTWTYTTDNTLPEKYYNTVYVLGTDTDATVITSSSIKYQVEHSSGSNRPATQQPSGQQGQATETPQPTGDKSNGRTVAIVVIGILVICLIIWGLSKLFGKKRKR